MLSKDVSLLQAALIGYQQRRAEIDRAIAEINAKLGGKTASPVMDGQSARRRKPLSAAARKRIAAAQKERWAEYRKRNAA